MIRKQKRLGCLVVLVLGLAGCTGAGRDAKPMFVSDTSPVVISEASSSYGGGDVQATGQNLVMTSRREDTYANSSVITINQGGMLQEHPLSAIDELSNKINVPSSTLHEVPVTAALQAVLAGTNIPLSWSGSLNDRKITVENLSGSLPVVVNKFCTAAQVFCSYRNGSLELQTEETFIVNLPPQDKSSPLVTAIGNGILTVLNQDDGNKVQVDPQGESILYTTDVVSQNKVHNYLEQLRNGRPLIAMQLYVWDVALDDINREGINWNAMRAGLKTTPKAEKTTHSPSLEPKDATESGVSLNVIALDQVHVRSLAEFLARQGHLRTVEDSQIAFPSNATPPVLAARLGAGDTKQDYVGQLLSQGKDIDIGVSGTYDSGLVTADLHVALKDNHPIAINTTLLNVDTIIRVRPGDNLVLAGVVSPQSQSSDSVLHKQDYKAHEIVIVIKPTVYLFANMLASTPNKSVPLLKNATASTVSETEWPAPVVIDKDGVKPLAGPQPLPRLTPALPVLPHSTIDTNAPAAVIYNSTNAAVLENLSIPYPSIISGDGL